MRPEATFATVDERVAALNGRYRHHAARAVFKEALNARETGRVALVSSFGAESVVLLHMVSVDRPSLPVIFVDTEMLFPETLQYQIDVASQLGLTNVQVVKASRTQLALHDPKSDLHKRDTDACCNLRKTEPLEAALTPYDAWITGRKRFQSGTRAKLDFFEAEGDRRIKINPLAHWAPADVQDYMWNNKLPRHPLVAQGYPSIGCAPCTTKVAEGEDPRSGRWRDQDKEECGIHFVDGKIVRGPLNKEDAA
ncbi:phosphoadenylyl-sulfate reductase [Pontivivens insulae]|uniref:Adenosine 5'-phosphosulfate reductase n=1 Tax=Pontivivens insulae TaxID=1639689 RepID=A0A2R8AA09_9RHOB|nr:phosphoadenylyl-sulfate reductase [Pontivivens insulae]RED12969.1 phosphoadenylylsulfate reductase (thioredoxin) [Pontivivens insulae]SPF29062.1 putative phosphoadenosine phosphosulfate reductase [Pontivivens insulae]